MACIGIDLGTTHGCVGVMQGGKVNIIANDQGFRCTPCYISFAEESVVVGSAASQKLHSHASKTVYHLKRVLGKEKKNVADLKTMYGWTFNVDETKEGKATANIQHNEQDRALDVEEFSTIILSNLKKLAEDFTGESVEYTVVNVPVYYSEEQRGIVRRAAESAGLKVLNLIQDPLAAAIAYGLDVPEEDAEPSTVVVFDLGGATLDVSVLNIDQGLMSIVSSIHDEALGGEDLTNALMEHCLQTFKRKQNIDLSTNQRALIKLRVQCEYAKRCLSQQNQVNIEVDSIAEGKDFSMKISSARYEDLVIDLLRKTVSQISKALEAADLHTDDVSKVLMVGGASRMPRLIKMVETLFNGKKASINLVPDEVVATGATLEADSLLATVGNNLDLLPKPSATHEVDVSPLSVGVALADGTVSPVLYRQTVVPCEARLSLPAPAGEKSAWIAIYEGERLMAKDNVLLATCGLKSSNDSGFEEDEELEIVMSINKQGLLRVSVEETVGQDKNKAEVLITADSSRYASKEAVDAVVADAEAHADEDDALLEQLEQESDEDEGVSSVAQGVASVSVGEDMD